MNISIRQLFGRKPKSSSIAKQRLKLVITQDRLDVDDRMMMRLQHELTEVLAKYFEFSMNSVQVSLKTRRQLLHTCGGLSLQESTRLKCESVIDYFANEHL